MIRLVSNENAVLIDRHTHEPWGMLTELSVTDDPKDWPANIPGDRLVVRCAGINSEPSPMRWMPSGWQAFDYSVSRAVEAADRRGVELLIRPAHDGMLSDAVACASWARKMESSSVGLMLDPLGWLSPSMMGDAADHLARIAELMIECTKISGVLMQVSAGQEDLDAAMVEKALGTLIEGVGVVVEINQADAGG